MCSVLPRPRQRLFSPVAQPLLAVRFPCSRRWHSYFWLCAVGEPHRQECLCYGSTLPLRRRNLAILVGLQIVEQLRFAQLALLRIRQALQHKAARRNLIVADNQRVARAELVGKAQRLFQLHLLGRQFDRKSFLAQLPRQLHRRGVDRRFGTAQPCNKDIDVGCALSLPASCRASTSRSVPMANPMPLVGGPPRSSTRPS